MVRSRAGAENLTKIMVFERIVDIFDQNRCLQVTIIIMDHKDRTLCGRWTGKGRKRAARTEPRWRRSGISDLPGLGLSTGAIGNMIDRWVPWPVKAKCFAARAGKRLCRSASRQMSLPTASCIYTTFDYIAI